MSTDKDLIHRLHPKISFYVTYVCHMKMWIKIRTRSLRTASPPCRTKQHKKQPAECETLSG